MDEVEEENQEEDQEEDETESKGLGGLFSQFTKGFWIVNS